VRARLALLFAVCLLAGCGDAATRAPFAESRTPPALTPRFYPPPGWAWGFLKVGDGLVQRYGVSAPDGVARGDILILPDAEDSAEVWFETARDLNARGYVVWVLEAPGQGGSQRPSPWRAVAHPPSVGEAARGVVAMARVVVRPAAGRLTLLADRSAAPVARRAAAKPGPISRLVLSAPAAAAPWRLRLRLATPTPWRRDEPDDRARGLTHDPLRGAVRGAWRLANPDLRRSEPSLRAGKEDVAAGAPGLPTLIIATDQAAGAPPPCADLACTRLVIAGARPALPLQADAPRDAWLDAIDRFATPTPP